MLFRAVFTVNIKRKIHIKKSSDFFSSPSPLRIWLHVHTTYFNAGWPFLTFILFSSSFPDVRTHCDFDFKAIFGGGKTHTLRDMVYVCNYFQLTLVCCGTLKFKCLTHCKIFSTDTGLLWTLTMQMTLLSGQVYLLLKKLFLTCLKW